MRPKRGIKGPQTPAGPEIGLGRPDKSAAGACRLVAGRRPARGAPTSRRRTAPRRRSGGPSRGCAAISTRVQARSRRCRRRRGTRRPASASTGDRTQIAVETKRRLLWRAFGQGSGKSRKTVSRLASAAPPARAAVAVMDAQLAKIARRMRQQRRPLRKGFSAPMKPVSGGRRLDGGCSPPPKPDFQRAALEAPSKKRGPDRRNRAGSSAMAGSTRSQIRARRSSKPPWRRSSRINRRLSGPLGSGRAHGKVQTTAGGHPAVAATWIAGSSPAMRRTKSRNLPADQNAPLSASTRSVFFPRSRRPPAGGRNSRRRRCGRRSGG